MGLRWRWTLVLVAAAAGLMAVAGVGVESILRARMGAESRQWKDETGQRLESHFTDAIAAVELSVRTISSDDALAGVFDTRQPTDAQRLVR